MEKEFIPYEQALALKELKFDEPCFDYYIPNKNNDPVSKIFDSYSLGKHNSNTNTIYKNGIISRPLYQQAFRWFREKYHLHSYIIDSKSYNWYFNIDDMIKDDVISEVLYFNTYEEAESACLRKLIEIIKNK